MIKNTSPAENKSIFYQRKKHLIIIRLNIMENERKTKMHTTMTI
jgi:hypothetical protein